MLAPGTNAKGKPMAADSWYYSAGGQQAGPVTTAQLQQMIAQGRVSPQDVVWREGMTDWLAAATIPELSTSAPYNAAPNPYQPVQQPYPQQGYQQPPYGQAGGYQQPLNYGGYQQVAPGAHNGKAVTAFVLSLVGLLCFGIILEPIAVIMAIVAISAMNKSGDVKGKGLATAAIIIGSIVFVLNVIYLVYILGNMR